MEENSWHTILKKHVEKVYNNELDNIKNQLLVKPETIEAKYYKLKFIEKFGINHQDVIPNYWQPKWDKDGNELKNYVDPSARELSVY